jgi:hypothetical protein
MMRRQVKLQGFAIDKQLFPVAFSAPQIARINDHLDQSTVAAGQRTYLDQ